MVDVEERPLRPFEQDRPPGGVGLRQRPRDVAEHRCDGDGGLDRALEVLGGRRLGPRVAGERLLEFGARGGDGFPEAPRVAGEAEADAGPPRPPLVRRPDPAAGRSQLGGAARRLAREIEGAVAGKHDVGAGGDQQPGPHRHRLVLEHPDLLEQRGGVDHDARPDQASARGLEDAGRDEVKGEVAVGELDGVAGVVAAVEADDVGEGRTEQIHDLPLALVTPLTPDDHDVRHHRSLRPRADRSLYQIDPRTSRETAVRGVLPVLPRVVRARIGPCLTGCRARSPSRA